MQACARFLAESLYPENCVGVLRLADTHSLVELKARVHEYIVQNFGNVVEHEEVLELPLDVLVELLQRDELAVNDEECVYEAAMRWVKARHAERLPSLAQVLAHVRLPLLEPCYFLEKVESDAMIRSCTEIFPLLQEARAYHLSGSEVLFTHIHTHCTHVHTLHRLCAQTLLSDRRVITACGLQLCVCTYR